MFLDNNKGAALITVIVVILILTILASVMLILLLNQNRYLEHNTARTRAKYAVEAGMVMALDSLRRTDATPTTHTVPGTGWTVKIDRGSTITSGPFNNTDPLNVSLDYTL